MTEDRAAVTTYVPTEQKDIWEADADDLDMSLSEFVRSMVQAGRSDFALESKTTNDTTAHEDADPRGNGFEDRILEALESQAPQEPDELLGAVTTDLEDEFYDAIDDLEADEQIRFDPREGGYVRR